MKINRADRVVHLHAVRDECIAYAIPMQRPVAVPVSGRSPALLSARAVPSERASEEESLKKEKPRRRRRRRRRILSSPDLAKLLHFSRPAPVSGRGVRDTSGKTDRPAARLGWREIEIFQGEVEREKEGDPELEPRTLHFDRV